MLSAERRGLLLLLLATALLYLPALSAEFVGFDDYEYVKANPDVRQPEVLRVFDLQHTTVADWTPVGTLSYALEYRLFGLDARAFHATNLLLHLACLVLMYFLLRDLEVSASLALLATLVFAIHPLQVESVAWVSARKNLLAAFFGLAFCREFLAGRALSATLFLLLALGSKGTAVVFPLWAAVLWACGFGALRRRQGAVWLVLFAALAAARAVLSLMSQAVVIGPRDASLMTLSQRLTIIGRVLSTQLRQFFLPSDLSLYYSWTLGHWSEPRVLVSWAVVLGVVVATIWLARRDVRIGVMGSFVVLGLLPTLNIVPAPYFQADRYTPWPWSAALYWAFCSSGHWGAFINVCRPSAWHCGAHWWQCRQPALGSPSGATRKRCGTTRCGTRPTSPFFGTALACTTWRRATRKRPSRRCAGLWRSSRIWKRRASTWRSSSPTAACRRRGFASSTC